MSAKSNSHKIDGKTYIFAKKITAEEAAARIAKKKEDVMPTALPRDGGDIPAPKAPAPAPKAPAAPAAPDEPDDDDDEGDKKIKASSYARRYRRAKGKGLKAVSGYNTLATPQTYKDKSVMKSSEYNPLTRMKPLVPNLLDVARINALNMNMAKRAASGYQWGIVDQK
jgi:hypothetical protein